MSDPEIANLREAVVTALAQHRPPVYGAYPHSNGSAHWREHMANVIVARTTLTERTAAPPARRDP